MILVEMRKMIWREIDWDRDWERDRGREGELEKIEV